MLRMLCPPLCGPYDMLQGAEPDVLLCGWICSPSGLRSALHGEHVLPQLLPQARHLRQPRGHEEGGLHAVSVRELTGFLSQKPLRSSRCLFGVFEARPTLEIHFCMNSYLIASSPPSGISPVWGRARLQPAEKERRRDSELGASPHLLSHL